MDAVHGSCTAYLPFTVQAQIAGSAAYAWDAPVLKPLALTPAAEKLLSGGACGEP